MEEEEKKRNGEGGKGGGGDEQSWTVRKGVQLKHGDENSRTEAHSPLQHRARGQPEATARVSRATQTS